MSKEMVQTYKIPIIKPLNTDWETFGKVAGDLTYNIIKVMNYTMTMNYVHIQEKFEYKNKTGEDFNVEKKYGVKVYKTIIYRTLKEKYKDFNIPSGILNDSIREALSTFNTNSLEVLKGNASLMVFRRDQPIPVQGRVLKISEDYTIKLPFMTKELAESYGFTGRGKQSFEVQLKTHKNSKLILDRILSGEYKVADSKVKRDLKGKWYLLLSYKQPVKENKLKESRIMGIDLGISKAVYVALNDSKENFFIDGGEVSSFRRRIRSRRKSLQNQLRVCSDNRKGHGRKTLLKPLEKLSEKEKNIRDTVNHRYSKKIVEWAVKNEVGTIQMEDLSGISKDNSFLANWDYFDLQYKIKYKAEREGIEFKKIKPRYTSQRCNECGHIHKENRKDQEIFKCVQCGHKTNADLNASRNIAVKDIEDIIDKELGKQNKAVGV